MWLTPTLIWALMTLCHEITGAWGVRIYFSKTKYNYHYKGLDLEEATDGMIAFEVFNVTETTVSAINYQDTVLLQFIEESEGGERIRCSAYEVRDYKDREDFLLFTKHRYLTPYTYVKLEEMLSTLTKCETVDGLLWSQEHGAMIYPLYGPVVKPQPVLSGVVPKTRWCGKGFAATHFNDLGKNAELDKCCRTLSFCPIKIYKSDGNLHESRRYEHNRYLCECEIAFFNCLQSPNNDNKLSKYFKLFYYTHLRPSCLKLMNVNDREFIQVNSHANPNKLPLPGYGELAEKEPQWYKDLLLIYETEEPVPVDEFYGQTAEALL